MQRNMILRGHWRQMMQLAAKTCSTGSEDMQQRRQVRKRRPLLLLHSMPCEGGSRQCTAR